MILGGTSILGNLHMVGHHIYDTIFVYHFISNVSPTGQELRTLVQRLVQSMGPNPFGLEKEDWAIDQN